MGTRMQEPGPPEGAPGDDTAQECPPEEIRMEWVHRNEHQRDITDTSEMVKRLMNHTVQMQTPSPVPAGEVRSHLLLVPEIECFRDELPTVFEKATDPEFVSNPQMREMLMVQLKLRELVQGGQVSENAAKHAVGKLAMAAARASPDPS